MFKIPAYSQQLDVKDKKWRDKSCGIVSLKMLMDFYLPKNRVEIDELIQEGVEMDAYVEKTGWKHAGLAKLAKAHGLKGKNFDWAEMPPEKAFLELFKRMDKPLIASIYSNLRPKASGHLVIITGCENGKVYYNDPDSKKRAEIPRSAPVDKFLRGWKKRIILVYN